MYITYVFLYSPIIHDCRSAQSSNGESVIVRAANENASSREVIKLLYVTLTFLDYVTSDSVGQSEPYVVYLEIGRAHWRTRSTVGTHRSRTFRSTAEVCRVAARCDGDLGSRVLGRAIDSPPANNTHAYVALGGVCVGPTGRVLCMKR